MLSALATGENEPWGTRKGGCQVPKQWQLAICLYGVERVRTAEPRRLNATSEAFESDGRERLGKITGRPDRVQGLVKLVKPRMSQLVQVDLREGCSGAIPAGSQ